MLGTDLVEKHSKAFLRRNKAYLSEMAQGFDTLENYVDARNEVSKKWLEWLGFEIGEPEPMGVLGLPFHKFEMRVS